VYAAWFDWLIACITVAWVGLSRWTFRWIDDLTGELARRNAELERRDATLRALHRLSLAITATSDLGRILQLVVDEAVALLPADAAVLRIERGPESGPVVGGDRALVRESAGFGGHGGGSSGPEPAIDIEPRSTPTSRLASPLQRGSETIGILEVASRRQRLYGADEVETLASLANQAAIAIEQARLQERLRELAVTEERERIAREMHDGLAQVLGYVSTKSQAVEHLLDTGRVVDARSQLDQLAGAARSIYVDVREAILGLRSSIEPGVGLVPAIETYARRFSEASKLVVVVEASEAARSVTLGDAGDDEVFRIVQEALTNVRKHAGAGRVTIRIDIDGHGSEGRGLVVSVADDGHGMTPSPDDRDWPRYGLAAMRERAARVRGSLSWTSQPGVGTSVRLEVPTNPVAPVTSLA